MENQQNITWEFTEIRLFPAREKFGSPTSRSFRAFHALGVGLVHLAAHGDHLPSTSRLLGHETDEGQYKAERKPKQDRRT